MRFLSHAALGASVLLLTACGHLAGQGLGAGTSLQPRSGSATSGQANFRQQGDRVLVRVEVSGLTPGQEHGLHIHDKGDCGDNGNAAAGHFNPLGNPHGKYDSTQHHMGDLPSLKADSNGVATVNVQSADITLLAGPGNVIGRAVIVHAQPDDYTTQPTGNAGARIACAVISRD